MEEFKEAGKAGVWGQQQGIFQFSGGRHHTVSAKDRKKFNFNSIRSMLAVSHNRGSMETLGSVYNRLKEIKEDDNIPIDQKLDLLQGEMDMMLREYVLYFKKNWDVKGQIPDPSIETIMERYH